MFCGTGTYDGVRELVDKPGTDGTVRRAGCGMSARKIEVDLTDQALMVRRKILPAPKAMRSLKLTVSS